MPIKVIRDAWTRQIKIFVLEYRDHQKYVLHGNEWEFVAEGASMPMPTVIIQRDDIDELLKELLKLDVKPTAHSKLEGTLDATKFHLEDLRTLLKLKK